MSQHNPKQPNLPPTPAGGTTQPHTPGKHGAHPTGHKAGTQASQDYAPFLRSLQGNRLAGIQLHGDGIRLALQADPEEMAKTALSIARTGIRLPRNVLTAQDRPIYARMMYDGQDTFVRATAQGINLSGMVPTVEGTTPAVLLDLIDRKDAYLGIKLLGQRVRDAALDLRLVYGAYQFYLIDHLMSYLETRFADPYLTRQDMEALLDDFGPALVKLDDMLRKGPLRKTELINRRDTAESEAMAAQDEADTAQVIYDLHNDVTPARQDLLKAARVHMASKTGTTTAHAHATRTTHGAGAAGHAAHPTAGGATPTQTPATAAADHRKMIR